MRRAWNRWQDWMEVLIGVLVLLSPIVVDTNTAAVWTLVVLGALIAIDGLISLARPAMVYGEWVQIVLGVLLFISPWVMGYSEFGGASWVSWIGGVLTVVLGALAVPAASNAARLAGTH